MLLDGNVTNDLMWNDLYIVVCACVYVCACK